LIIVASADHSVPQRSRLTRRSIFPVAATASRALDAAIAANVMNMYGPHAPAITSVLTAQFAHDLDYPADVLLTYQAAYAVATSNAFTSDGSDGHFAWCIDQLRRPDITDLLGL
jgi:hypothetical protein